MNQLDFEQKMQVLYAQLDKELIDVEGFRQRKQKQIIVFWILAVLGAIAGVAISFIIINYSHDTSRTSLSKTFAVLFSVAGVLLILYNKDYTAKQIPKSYLIYAKKQLVEKIIAQLFPKTTYTLELAHIAARLVRQSSLFMDFDVCSGEDCIRYSIEGHHTELFEIELSNKKEDNTLIPVFRGTFMVIDLTTRSLDTEMVLTILRDKLALIKSQHRVFSNFQSGILYIAFASHENLFDFNIKTPVSTTLDQVKNSYQRISEHLFFMEQLISALIGK